MRENKQIKGVEIAECVTLCCAQYYKPCNSFIKKLELDQAVFSEKSGKALFENMF